MTFLCVLISVGEEKDDFNTPTVVFKNTYDGWEVINKSKEKPSHLNFDQNLNVITREKLLQTNSYHESIN